MLDLCELHCKLIRIYVIWTLNFIHCKKHQTHEGIRKKNQTTSIYIYIIKDV